MLSSFRSFAQKFPRLGSGIGNSLALTLPTGLAISATQYVTNKIKDPLERQIIWNNFLDVEGCRQALKEYHKKNRPK